MEFLRFIEGIRTPFLDSVFGLATHLGDETVVVVVICAIFWCINKQVAYRICIAFFFSGLTVLGMKICFRVDRPWVIDPTFKPVPSALKGATGYSFPSGHTQSAAALFGTLGAVIKHKPAKVLCFFIVFLVALTRLYLGVHTIIDVAASLVITLLLVAVSVKVFADGTAGKKNVMILSLVMALYSAAVVVVAAELFRSGKIEQSNLSDCVKAAGIGIGFSVGMYIERVYINFSTRSKSYIWQIIKFVPGLAGVLAIQEGLKPIIGAGLIADGLRYFLMIMWVTVLFPLIIKRFFTDAKDN